MLPVPKIILNPVKHYSTYAKTKSRKQICSEITVNSPGNPLLEYTRSSRSELSGAQKSFVTQNSELSCGLVIYAKARKSKEKTKALKPRPRSRPMPDTDKTKNQGRRSYVFFWVRTHPHFYELGPDRHWTHPLFEMNCLLLRMHPT